APMPGLVRALHVAVGQVVQKGDPLVTLEAMKMENVLKATAEGTVTALHATQDAAVEKGVLLISFS
ncbi:MAG: biotin/lipoyl-containing protein, partial [Bacteroidia bacterium]|nr:biotin/lipoyl-containing protein [Bacteroidia bacterium]